MADSINAQGVTSEWTDLNTLFSIPIGTECLIQVVGNPNDLIELWISDTKPTTQRGEIIKQYDPAYRVNAGESTVWGRFIIQARDVNVYTPNNTTRVIMRQVDTIGHKVSSDFKKSAFNDLITVIPKRIIHILPTNGLTNQLTISEFGTGTVDTVDGKLRAKTGTTAFSFASVLSDSLPYKTGCGVRADFTAKFYGPANGTQQLAGFITATDGPCFAYDDVDGVSTFGIMLRHYGENEIQELQYTVGASGAETVVVRINGTDYNVNLTAGTVQKNARETAVSLNAQVPLFQFRAHDDTVTVFGNVARPSTGTYTFTPSGTAAASFTQITAGERPIETFIPQSEWDDPMPGLDPTKLNVYSISVQYLGAGNMFFYIEDVNTGRFKQVHMIKYAGLYEIPSLADPNMRVGLTAASLSLSATTDISVESASISGFIDGDPSITADPTILENTVISVSTTPVNLLTIRNRLVRGVRANRVIAHIRRVTGYTESVKSGTIHLIRNATLGGTANYQYVDKELSIIEYDISGTTVTGGEEIESLFMNTAGDGELNGDLDIHVHPGESITFAGQLRKTPAAEMTVTVEILEDL